MTKLEITTQAFERGQKMWFLFEGLRSPYLAVHISVIIQNICRGWIFHFPFGLLFTIVWKFQVLTLFSPKWPNIPYPSNKLVLIDLIEVVWASDIYSCPLDPPEVSQNGCTRHSELLTSDTVLLYFTISFVPIGTGFRVTWFYFGFRHKSILHALKCWA